MDLIKKLTGKNPSEYEEVAKSLVNNSDTELFAKLVKQDDFLFEFIKNNVAKRIQDACNKDNYLNLLNFLKYYSSSYDTMIARVLHSFSGDELLPEMKEFFINGTNPEKAYATKYFSFVTPEKLSEILPLLRQTALSSYEPLAFNSIEVLSLLNDNLSKQEALNRLESKDEFEQYEAVKFLVAYQAKDALNNIIAVMKKSTLSENIAAEIPYLININELLSTNFDDGILVLCNIINAIPDILPLSIVNDLELQDVLRNLPLTSSSAVLLRLAKNKFSELTSNEEYLFDSDKNTKDTAININKFLQGLNSQDLENLLYEELYEESDFVFFALDYIDEKEELEALLDSNNQTLMLKVLSILKEKKILEQSHKDNVLPKINSLEIKNVINAL